MAMTFVEPGDRLHFFGHRKLPFSSVDQSLSPVFDREMIHLRILLSLAVIGFTSVAAADEVEDSIKEALKLYKEGKLTEASTSLQIAVSAISDKKGGSVASALPDQIGKWKGGKAENSNSLAMLGGGTTAERKYTQGDRTASITIVADSPMIGQVVGLMANPTIAGLAGFKIKKIGGHTLTVQKDQGMGQLVVDNRFLIQISGSDLSEDEVVELATGVKSDVLKEIQ